MWHRGRKWRLDKILQTLRYLGRGRDIAFLQKMLCVRKREGKEWLKK